MHHFKSFGIVRVGKRRAAMVFAARRIPYLNVTTVADELAACESVQLAATGPVTYVFLSSTKVLLALEEDFIMNPDPATGGVAGHALR